MKTSVTFRSSKFPPYDGEDKEINPAIWGRRLAEYFTKALKARGFDCDAYILEDWGYFLPVHIDRQRVALCCGHQNGHDDQFLVFADPRKPRIWRWFLQAHLTRPLTQLTEVLAAVIDSDPDLRDVQWSEPQ